MRSGSGPNSRLLPCSRILNSVPSQSTWPPPATTTPKSSPMSRCSSKSGSNAKIASAPLSPFRAPTMYFPAIHPVVAIRFYINTLVPYSDKCTTAEIAAVFISRHEYMASSVCGGPRGDTASSPPPSATGLCGELGLVVTAPHFRSRSQTRPPSCRHRLFSVVASLPLTDRWPPPYPGPSPLRRGRRQTGQPGCSTHATAQS